MKRIIAWLTFLVLAVFLGTSFFVSTACASFTVSAAGGGNERVEEETDEDIKLTSEILRAGTDFVASCLDGTGSTVVDKFLNSSGLEDLLCMASGYIGAVFTEQTFSQVNNSFRTLYMNDYSGSVTSEDIMHTIFYLGTDGNLYFTDDFISMVNSSFDSTAWQNGIYACPPCYNSDVINTLYNSGIAMIQSKLNNALVSDKSAFVYLTFDKTGSLSKYIDYSSFFSTHVPIIYGNAFSPSQSQAIPLYLVNTDGIIFNDRVDWTLFDFLSFNSDGTYKSSVANGGLGTQSYYFGDKRPLSFVSISAYYYFGRSTLTCYRTLDWYNYYLSGNTAVVYADVGTSLEDALSSDVFDMDWQGIYSNWQKQYAKLADDVANGAADLNDISYTLGSSLDLVIPDVDEIRSNTNVSNTLLRQILDEIKDISGKLTYSGVVETVGAASEVVSAVGTWFDSLITDSVSDISSLFDDVVRQKFQTKFPFSLPYDFYLIVKLLAHEPVEPSIEYRLYVASINLDYNFSYHEFYKFEAVAKITRFFSTIFFVYGLINQSLNQKK